MQALSFPSQNLFQERDPKTWVENLGPEKIPKSLLPTTMNSDEVRESRKNLRIEMMTALFPHVNKISDLIPSSPGKHIISFNHYKYPFERIGKKIYLITKHHLGKGREKTVKIVWDPQVNELYARAVGFGLDKEIKWFESFRGNEQFVQLITTSSLPCSRFPFREKKTLIMELCDNSTLGDLLKKHPDLTEQDERELSFVLFDVLKGLVIMAEKQVLHRDLKPKNIFLSRHPEGNRRGKIGDFGYMIKCKNGSKNGPGTPLYMSPEYIFANICEEKKPPQEILRSYPPKKLEMIAQINKKCKEYLNKKNEYASSPKNDLWAFGCILYEVLYGAPLYDTLYKHKSGGNDLRAHMELYYLLSIIEQNEILDACPQENLVSSFQQNIHKILSLILILDPDNRPTAGEVLAHYQDLFRFNTSFEEVSHAAP